MSGTIERRKSIFLREIHSQEQGTFISRIPETCYVSDGREIRGVPAYDQVFLDGDDLCRIGVP